MSRRASTNRTPKLRLFVWKSPYGVQYGSSQVWAVAETVEKARRLACSKRAVTMAFGSRSHKQNDWTNMKLGEPSDVIDLPCAVWDEWSE